MSAQTPAGGTSGKNSGTQAPTEDPTAAIKPLPQVAMQPMDPQLEASQAAIDDRIQRKAAGEVDVPPLGASAVDTDGHAPPARTVAQIEADMEATRQRLTATLTELQGAVTEAVDPRNIMQRQVARVRNYYIDEYGAIRVERVAGTVGVVVSVVVVVKVTRRVLR